MPKRSKRGCPPRQVTELKTPAPPAELSAGFGLAGKKITTRDACKL